VTIDAAMYWIGAGLVAATLGLGALYARNIVRSERRARETHAAAVQAGLTEPPSLHPVIDEIACIGCASCVDACPEGGVLGLIDGRAALVEPTHCIGHGACRTACPTNAINLVFGTERRGVEIPHVRPNFETNVPGLFIAGELGGMGLIRNAVEQGRQALVAIRERPGVGSGGGLDLVIVGAGAAGFAASLGAQQAGLSYVTLEQDSLGGTVAHYPRGKLVMTSPVELPLVGRMPFRETTKEELLVFWTEIERRTGLRISYRERAETIERDGADFVVRTAAASYRCRAVLLATGRRGTPRKLDVPGEEQSKVVYRLVDAEQYRGQRVLVVGGGDSALEAAAGVAGQPGTDVTLSYRSEAFSRAKPRNREQVDRLTRAGRIRLLLGSEVLRIGAQEVEIALGGSSRRLPNDAVIVCAGGVLPGAFLRRIGVEVETKHGTA